MVKFINRLLQRLYWFSSTHAYPDQLEMSYFNTSAIFSALLVSHVWTIINFSGFHKFSDNFVPFIIVCIVILIISMLIFKIKRKKIEPSLIKSANNMRFTIFDVLVVVYLIFSFFTVFFSMVYAKGLSE